MDVWHINGGWDLNDLRRSIMTRRFGESDCMDHEGDLIFMDARLKNCTRACEILYDRSPSSKSDAKIQWRLLGWLSDTPDGFPTLFICK